MEGCSENQGGSEMLRIFCPASKQVVYTPRWAVPDLAYVRILKLGPNGPSKLGKAEVDSLRSF